MDATAKTLVHYKGSMPDVIEISCKEEKSIVAEFFGISLEHFGMILSRMGFDKNARFPWRIDTNEVAKSLLLVPDPNQRTNGNVRHGRQTPYKRRQPHGFRAQL